MEYDLIILDNYYTLHSSLNPIPLIRWMKKLCRQGIAFLVLDHTNTEGELQGSQVKKRAMDLGLKLELLKDNKMTFSFQSDRYGREHSAEPFMLSPCFTTQEFSYDVEILTKNIEQETAPLSQEVSVCAAVVGLKNKKLQNKDVAEKLGLSESKVSRILKKIGLNGKMEFENNNSATETKRTEAIKILESFSLDDLVEFVTNADMESRSDK